MTGKLLDGKVIRVTGAGNGISIGAEIAKMAARRSACVVVNDLGASRFGPGEDKAPAHAPRI